MSDVAETRTGRSAHRRRAPAGATVIPFPTATARRRATGAFEGTGRILFFTGVRYERLPEPAAPRRRPAAARRKTQP